MIIYLDVVFLENICMNYIILLATGYILKRNVSYTRILVSSFLGGIYVVITYITNFQTLLSITMKILLSIAMIYIAFGSNEPKKQIKEILVFYLTSFVFGGTAFAMIYFIKPQNVIMKNGVYIGTYAFNTIFIGGIIGFFLINIVFRIVKRKLSKEDMKCELKIVLKGKKIKVKTMLDTGNLLKDPISRKPVAIVEKDLIKHLIPGLIIESIERNIGGDNLEFNNNIKEYISIFKLIPFSSLGKEHRINISI